MLFLASISQQFAPFAAMDEDSQDGVVPPTPPPRLRRSNSRGSNVSESSLYGKKWTLSPIAYWDHL